MNLPLPLPSWICTKDCVWTHFLTKRTGLKIRQTATFLNNIEAFGSVVKHYGYCLNFMVKLEFGDFSFCGGRKTGEYSRRKSLWARWEQTTNSNVRHPARIGGNWVTDWWKANDVTTKLYMLTLRKILSDTWLVIPSSIILLFIEPSNNLRVRSFGIFRNRNIFRNIFRLFCSWEQNSRNGNPGIPEWE